MIKNERQYHITRAQADKLEQSLSRLLQAPDESRPSDPLARQLQEDTLRSLLADLHAELQAYEALRSGQVTTFQIETIDELPRALIQARIASGLSQRDLAERLNLKEQQIQRYEATDYASASLDRVLAIAHALGIVIRSDVFVGTGQVSLAKLLARLKEVGLRADFALRRLIPLPVAAQLEDHEARHLEGFDKLVLQAASAVGRVFGWTPASIFGSGPLAVNSDTAGLARFKVPARVNEPFMSAYTVYAHFLAMLVLDATSGLPRRQIPVDAREVREAILAAHGDLSFESILRYVWSLGVPVLPLSDPGAFHGACWRLDGRNVIVIKQQTTFEARWSFDLLHELWHAGQERDEQTFTVIEPEEESPGRDSSADERKANRFAGDVLLEGRAEELAQLCVARAKGHLEWLTNVVPRVAAQEKVPADALAYYLAFRLSLQGENWWGAATNFQHARPEMLRTARDVLLERGNFALLSEPDQTLLLQSLSPDEGIATS